MLFPEIFLYCIFEWQVTLLLILHRPLLKPVLYHSSFLFIVCDIHIYVYMTWLIRANAKLVYACEWNPHALEALRRNLHANSVVDRCVVLEGDNRVTAPKV